MAAPAESKNAQDLSLTQTTAALARHYLGGRRGLIVFMVLALGAGLYYNWGWLAAAGIAPWLLALAPCAAMCALGICMDKTRGRSCSSEPSPVQGNGTDTPAGQRDEDRA